MVCSIMLAVRRHHKPYFFIFSLILLLSNTASSTETADVSWFFRASSSISAKPLLDGGELYFTSDIGTVYCMNASTFTVLWESKLPSKCNNPAVSREYLVLGCLNSIVYGFNKSSGERLWSQVVDAPINSNPASSDDRYYVGDDKGSIYSINPSNGKIIWRIKTGGAIKSTLLLYQDILYASSFDSHLYSLKASDGSQLWNYSALGSISSSPFKYDNIVYVGSNVGRLYAIDWETGQQYWNYTAKSAIMSKPVVSRNGVFFGSMDGSFYGIDREGNLMWNYSAGGFFNSDAVLYRGLLYAPYNNQLLVLNPEDGSLEMTYNTTGFLRTPPIFLSGNMILPATDGKLNVYGGSNDIILESVLSDREYMMPGRTTRLNVTVVNKGNLVLNSVNVSIKIDGKPVFSKRATLKPNIASHVMFNVSLPAGRHVMEASAGTMEDIQEKDSENNRMVRVLWVRDDWPMYRHDVERSGSTDAIDSFEKGNHRVSWQCIPVSDVTNVSSVRFLSELMKDGVSPAETRPLFNCTGFSELTGYHRNVNLSCGVVDYSEFVKRYPNVLQRIGGLSAGEVYSKADFNLTWGCDIQYNESLPFSNATVEWSCLTKEGYAGTAHDLWSCTMKAYSTYSLADYALMRDDGVEVPGLKSVSPMDYGLLWSFDAGSPIHASPSVADIDGSDDGLFEVLVASSKGVLYALHSDGGVYWTAELGAQTHSSPLIADLDGDGRHEVYLGDDDGVMHALDWRGRGLWTFKASGGIESSPLPVDLGELYGNGIAFGSNSGLVYLIDSRGRLLYNYSAQEEVKSSLSLVDIDGDGVNEIAFGSGDNNIYVISVPPYRYWMYQTNGDVDTTPSAYNTSLGRSNLVFASSSGVLSEVYYGISGYVQGDMKCDGASCWRESIPISKLFSKWAFVSRKPISSSPLVFDPYGNGSFMFSFGSDDHNLYILDSDGTRLERYSTSSRVRSSPSAISLDGEGINVFFGDDDGRVFIVDVNGTGLWHYDVAGPVRSSPAVVDLNGDGVLESVVSSEDGSVYVFGYSPGAYPATTTTHTTTTLVASTTSVTTTSTTTTSSTTTSVSATTLESSTSTLALASTTTHAPVSTSTSTSTTLGVVSTSTSSTTTLGVVSTSTSTSTTLGVVSTSTTLEASSTTTSSTTTTLPEECGQVFYTGVSPEECVKGTAINSVVLIPSEDLLVEVVHVINGSSANVTVTDSMLNTLAYTIDYSANGSVLNTSLTLKSGEIYFLNIKVSEGCASKTLSARVITPEGTWYVQDMWCSDGEYCPLSVELLDKKCATPHVEQDDAMEEVSGGPYIPAADYDALMVGSVIITAFALFFIIGFLMSKRRKSRGGKIKVVINTDSIMEKGDD
ncbi:MAG: PQQ-binding-like beta-propeller repeat protein [Candidatus Altiarchaeota archaeon]